MAIDKRLIEPVMISDARLRLFNSRARSAWL